MVASRAKAQLGDFGGILFRGMTPMLWAYVACWGAFCALAAAILVHDRRRLLPEWRAYLRFLLLPWKVALFVPALLFVTFAGRFTDDETWDVVTGSGMSILTYLTAAWAVGPPCAVAQTAAETCRSTVSAPGRGYAARGS